MAPGDAQSVAASRVESRIVAAARAFAESVLLGKVLRVKEIGLPSIGPDDSETHFVAIDGEDESFLACVTVAQDGLVTVDYLTAS